MPIFTEPDVTQYPSDFQSISCPGLEALTGADMVISTIPLPPTANLELHKANHSLFVQIKIGYDICSFDQLHSSIARMQSAQIPKGQAILLPIGEYWEDDTGLLRIKGQKAFGTTSYSTLGTIYDMWEYRGGTVESLPPRSINDLQQWIDRKVKSLEKVLSEGKKDIYPPPPTFTIEDIWQDVNEINDWRRFFVSGLEGFGSKTAQNVYDYISENYPENPSSAYLVLYLLTDEDEKGKAIHKIPNWGKVSRKKFREILGVPDGWSLGEMTYKIAFYQGWESFGNELIHLVTKKKLSVKDAVNKLMTEKKNMLTDFESQIPF